MSTTDLLQNIAGGIAGLTAIIITIKILEIALNFFLLFGLVVVFFVFLFLEHCFVL